MKQLIRASVISLVLAFAVVSTAPTAHAFNRKAPTLKKRLPQRASLQRQKGFMWIPFMIAVGIGVAGVEGGVKVHEHLTAPEKISPAPIAQKAETLSPLDNYIKLMSGNDH